MAWAKARVSEIAAGGDLEAVLADPALTDLLDDLMGWKPDEFNEVVDTLKGVQGFTRASFTKRLGAIRAERRRAEVAGRTAPPANGSAGVSDEAILGRARKAGKGVGEKFAALYDRGDVSVYKTADAAAYPSVSSSRTGSATTRPASTASSGRRASSAS